MNYIHKLSIGATAALLVLSMTGCGGMSNRDTSTVVGAGLGGAAGAVLTGGGAVGTLGGAAIGGVIGNQVGK